MQQSESQKSKYWQGPYGILIPNTINSVVAEDEYNLVYRSSARTNTYSYFYHKITEAQYKNKYAKYNAKDNCFYWKTNVCDEYCCVIL